jgi:hypothetical protein
MQELVFDVGILITAGLGVLGYLLKLRLQRKESARTVLFHLLEIRQQLLIEQPKLDKMVDEFQSELHGILGERPNLKALVANQIPREHIAALLASMFDGLVRADQKLLDSYENALFEYSRIDPLLTHRVRGMKLLPKVSENFSNVATSLIDTMPHSEEASVVNSLGRKQIESSHDNTVSELMVNLNTMIRRVSWKAGFWFWCRVWLWPLIWPAKEVQDESPTQDLLELLEHFFKSVLLATDPPGVIKAQIETATLEEILNLFEKQLSETSEK